MVCSGLDPGFSNPFRHNGLITFRSMDGTDLANHLLLPMTTTQQVGQNPPPHAHLVGVCGSGLKAAAEILLDQGWSVSGSDSTLSSPVYEQLTARSVTTYRGHNFGNVPPETSLLVYSAAVAPTNCERLAAKARQIVQKSYSEFLADLMATRTGVAVAGTHGKSTTTAMTSAILQGAGHDPLVAFGAELIDGGRSGWGGAGQFMVAESCEFQRHFLSYSPQLAAILDIEPDHFDYFQSDADLVEAFAQFAARIPASGYLLTRHACDKVTEAASMCAGQVETFGLDSTADWTANDIRQSPQGTRFRVYHRGRFVAEISQPLFGVHNVLNALAACALTATAGASATQIRTGLAEFTGIKRRFERLGSWRGVSLVDDYAHHPTAIQVTLQTIREVYGQRRIWAVFQPHQVSRTLGLMDQFARSFSQADRVIVAPVFAAREQVTTEAIDTSRQLVREISTHHSQVSFAESLDQIRATIDHALQPGDVLVTLGAGDIGQIHYEFIRRVPRYSGARSAARPFDLDEAGWSRSVLPHSA